MHEPHLPRGEPLPGEILDQCNKEPAIEACEYKEDVIHFHSKKNLIRI
jgi:hypothetical protein